MKLITLASLASTLMFAVVSEEVSEASSLRSKLAFIKERMSIRMKDVSPEKTTLMNIEKSIMSMAASKSKGQQTDLTAFLKEIEALLENTMKKNIRNRVAQTQADLDSGYGNLSSCTHPEDLDYNTAVESLSSTHVDCRNQQNAAWMDYDTTCILAREIRLNEIRALCNAFQTANVFPNPATTCAMDEGTKVPTIGNYLGDMAKFFRSEYDILYEKKFKCDNATNTPFPHEELCKQKICEYYDQKISCDEKQKSMEEKACTLHRSYTCSLFGECYTEKVDIYNGLVTLAKENEGAIKSEWIAVSRIECLVNALQLQDAEVDAGITACKEKSYSTDAVALTFKGDAPAQRSCKDTFLQPGTAVFSTKWYSGLPTNTPAESCASTCCMDTAYTPGYPKDAACPYVPGATTTTTTTTTTTPTTTTTAAPFVYRRGGRGGFR